MKDNRPAPYPLRMPNDVRLHLESLAKKNGKSLNSEIVNHLELALVPSSIKESTLTAEIAAQLAEKAQVSIANEFIAYCLKRLHSSASVGIRQTVVVWSDFFDEQWDTSNPLYTDSLNTTRNKLLALGYSVEVKDNSFIIEF